jgi:deoxyuridine 5'-triphosphate nucleotidohydrolase
MILEYVRVRGDVIPPMRANPSDVGLDLVFNPEDGNEVILKAGDTALFQTGYRFGIPHGFCLEVKNRSGNAAKRQLIVGACIVDPGYDGEVFVNLHNIGKDTQVITPGTKVAQAVMYPVVHFKAFEKHDKDLYDYYPMAMSDRKDGALGSTDRQQELDLNPKYADIYIDHEGER